MRMKEKIVKNQKGFTLIELLTVIAILGVLAGLSLQSLKVYRGSAAYGVATSTMRTGRTALEGSLNNIDVAYGTLALYSQTTQGPLVNAAARELLPTLQIPRNVKFEVAHDAACADSTCVADFMQAKHCQGLKYTNWTRWGDGVDLLVENIDGGGCS